MTDYRFILYVFSLAFQIAGAVLLIIKYWGKTKQRVIDEYYPGTGVANNDGEDNAILEVQRVRDCVTKIYANRMAFVYIAAGYALSIFGEKGAAVNNVLILLIAALISGFIIVLEMFCAKKLTNTIYKEDIIIPYNDLPDHIDRTMSTKDIDKIFQDTSGQ